VTDRWAEPMLEAWAEPMLEAWAEPMLEARRQGGTRHVVLLPGLTGPVVKGVRRLTAGTSGCCRTTASTLAPDPGEAGTRPPRTRRWPLLDGATYAPRTRTTPTCTTPTRTSTRTGRRVGLDGLVLLSILAVIVVLGAVTAAALAERWARSRGLELARRRLSEELGTPSVHLEVAGRPLLTALLRHPGTPIELHASDVPVADGAFLRELSATVRDVRADLRGRIVSTGYGTFVATIDERELDALLLLPSVVTRLEVRSEGLRVWTVLGIGIDAEVLVHDGALRVVPDPVQIAPLLRLPGVGAFRRTIEGAGLLLELPALPFGAIVEQLRFTTGAVVATGRLAPQQLQVRRTPDG
jgi:hypothetical protein